MPRLRSGRSHIWGIRSIAVAFVTVAVAVMCVFGYLLTADPTTASRPGPADASPPVHSAPCKTTVRGFVMGPATVSTGLLPTGYRLASGNPADITTGSVTYTASNERPDPSRIEISLTYPAGPLTWQVGGRQNARHVSIHDRPGLLESGPPGPRFINVFWKPRPKDLVSVVGYKMSESTVLRVAWHLRVTPPGRIPLETEPGLIVHRATAISIARSTVHFQPLRVTAKLSTWTEVLTLIRSSEYSHRTFKVSSALKTTPWIPIWVIRATRPGGRWRFVVLDAASGHVELVTTAGKNPSWFHALTDRDPAPHHGCKGGSSAHLPFGVLTRNEESYTQRSLFHLPRTTIILKLTTVSAMHYVGCTIQSCGPYNLLWPDIEVTHAPPGKLMPCPLNMMSHPAGVYFKPTKIAFSISAPNNSEGGCSRLPDWVSRLKDLAPPVWTTQRRKT